jgi:hypothetical protein
VRTASKVAKVFEVGMRANIVMQNMVGGEEEEETLDMVRTGPTVATLAMCFSLLARMNWISSLLSLGTPVGAVEGLQAPMEVSVFTTFITSRY